jgi:hypothetical protein
MKKLEMGGTSRQKTLTYILYKIDMKTLGSDG